MDSKRSSCLLYTSRILKGFDKYIKLKETDTIFITEPCYDGIEKRYAVILDDIARNKMCIRDRYQSSINSASYHIKHN